MVQSTNMQMPMPMQQPQQGGGANAVAINIYNPQAYGSSQGAQQPPYQAPQAFYNIPYASMYGNYAAPAQPQFVPTYLDNGMTVPQQWQQFMPITNVMNTPVQPMGTQFIAPAPQAMPESVISNNDAQVQQQEGMQETKPVEIVEPQTTAQVIDIDSLVILWNFEYHW